MESENHSRPADGRIGVAVVGLGIGRMHVLALKELRQHYRVVAVADRDLARATEVAGWLRDVDAVGSLDEVLARDEVEVVVLCTPPSLHEEQVMACLEAGRDVICEKPLVGSVAAVDRIAARAEATGRTVMPVFQYRFGTGLRRLQALVAAGRTGRHHLTTVEVAWRRGRDYYDEAPWRGRWATELGGTLTVHAAHHLDMVLSVLGMPVAVQASTATVVNEGIETEDVAAAVLRYADGSLVSLAATTGAAAESSRLRFCFEQLTATSSEGPYAPGADPWSWAAADADDQADLDARVAASVAPEPEDFVGQLARYAVARRATPTAASAPTSPAGGMGFEGALPVTLADARRVLEVLTAMYVSAREHREVPLPMPADHPALEGWQP